MPAQRKRTITGVGLIVVGVMFLLVTNGVLIGWRHIWPLFPVAAGVLMLRSSRASENPYQLAGGLVAVILGAFLLLFSVGILDWAVMETLWPVIPVVAGGSLLAGRLAGRTAGRERGSIVLEIGMIVFGALAFFFTTEAVSPRVAAPFVRFWPVVLILAGVAVLKLGGGEHDGDRAGGDDMDAVRAVLEDDEGSSEGAGSEEAEPVSPGASRSDR